MAQRPLEPLQRLCESHSANRVHGGGGCARQVVPPPAHQALARAFLARTRWHPPQLHLQRASASGLAAALRTPGAAAACSRATTLLLVHRCRHARRVSARRVRSRNT